MWRAGPAECSRAVALHVVRRGVGRGAGGRLVGAGLLIGPRPVRRRRAALSVPGVAVLVLPGRGSATGCRRPVSACGVRLLATALGSRLTVGPWLTGLLTVRPGLPRLTRLLAIRARRTRLLTVGSRLARLLPVAARLPVGNLGGGRL